MFNRKFHSVDQETYTRKFIQLRFHSVNKAILVPLNQKAQKNWKMKKQTNKKQQ